MEQNKALETSSNKSLDKRWTTSSVSLALNKIAEVAHPDRVIFSPAVVARELAGEDPEIVCKAIDRGIRGELGEVFRIDGITIMTWITKQKREIQEDQDNARKMNFFNNNY